MVNNYNNFCIAVLQNFELRPSSISKLHKKRKKKKCHLEWLWQE